MKRIINILQQFVLWNYSRCLNEEEYVLHQTCKAEFEFFLNVERSSLQEMTDKLLILGIEMCINLKAYIDELDKLR